MWKNGRAFMSGQPFYLFKRGRYFYVKFRLPSGKIGIAQSTKQKTKAAALTWCVDYLKRKTPRVSKDTLASFSQGFFEWDGQWSLNRRMKGKRTSPANCKAKEQILNTYVIPTIGNLKLHDINTAIVDQFSAELYKHKVSGSTINKALIIVRTLLNAASDANLIDKLPRIEAVAVHNKKREIFTRDEFKELFLAEWDDLRAYVAFLLGCTAGLRAGELQALLFSDIGKGHIYVHKSYDNRSGVVNHRTKSGKNRVAFFPKSVSFQIKKLMEQHPYPDHDAFLFYSTLSPNKPCEQRIFAKNLSRALASIGIDKKQQEERFLSFHTTRHFAKSSLVNFRIPIPAVDKMIGHDSAQMMEVYYHPGDGEDIREAQEQLFH